MRNGYFINRLKIFRFYLDCKSAYAGSIPTSASKLKTP
ncbi:hypothetical protein C4K16_3505 [Pseudomonas chlororaphis subsp. aurantiaca]|nr:hypothetical protein C4K16_3505 [Pseudomonas chlororaphis subsp. aurantiaca]AZD80097.1 hypothetical protein C4K15_3531 [Pseudomonas chlororaphis subsp. aurantiaca]